MSDSLLPGKLPPDLLATVGTDDPRVLVGPRPGMDAAVIDFGERCLVVKSDPITFATEEIGWYSDRISPGAILAPRGLDRSIIRWGGRGQGAGLYEEGQVGFIAVAPVPLPAGDLAQQV
jgi:hypothetical protein